MKGQTSIEFFSYFTISMAILALLFTSVADRQIEAFEFRENSLASNIGSSYGFELERADIVGEGYEKNLELPREILGSEYNVTVDQGFVIVEWGENNLVESARISNVDDSSDVKIESNEGPFKVKNNGSIYVVPQ